MQQIAVYLYRSTGAAIAIALMEVLARVAEEPLSRVPFVTSIVLVMAIPDSIPARAYNVVAGHMLSCVAGLSAFWLLGSGDAACAVGLGLALLLMLLAQALHPPAGINAFLIAAYGLPLSWAISPVLVGAIFLVGYKRVWWQTEQWLRTTDAYNNLPTSPDWVAGTVDAGALLKWRPYWRQGKATTDSKTERKPKQKRRS